MLILFSRRDLLIATVMKPKQILDLCHCKEDLRRKVHGIIDKYAERGLRSLAVARQVSWLLFFITFCGFDDR